MNERTREILKLLVQRYLDDGMPVASKTLVNQASLSISPATVRSIMATLEEQGYLHSPHTSAGRIPTTQGLQFFAQHLLHIDNVDSTCLVQLDPDQTPQALFQEASELLSQLTQCVSMVTLPRQTHALLRQIEFLTLTDNRLLVILVFNEKQVENRIIRCEHHFTQSELVEIGNYLTSAFAGLDLMRIRDCLQAEAGVHEEKIQDLMLSAVEIAEQILLSQNNADPLLLGGEHHFLQIALDQNQEQIKKLQTLFQEKQRMITLLNQCMHAEALQIFVGGENTLIPGYSLVTAPYQRDGRSLGVLGVIGPLRMPYHQVVPIVDLTAKMLSGLLNK